MSNIGHAQRYVISRRPTLGVKTENVRSVGLQVKTFSDILSWTTWAVLTGVDMLRHLCNRGFDVVLARSAQFDFRSVIFYVSLIELGRTKKKFAFYSYLKSHPNHDLSQK